MQTHIYIIRQMKKILFRFKNFIFVVFNAFFGVILWTIYSQTFDPIQTEIIIVEDKELNETTQCPLQWKSQWSENPLLKLDPEKFMLPLLINGPNNQMMGLRDAIFLSIALNRTLIMPHFYEHKSKVIVEPELRVNMKTLSSFISVKRQSEINKLCNEKIGALFITDRSLWMLKEGPPYHRLANISGVEKLRHGNSTTVRMLPTEDFVDERENQVTLKHIRKLYATNERCSLYVYPYRSAGTRESVSGIRSAREFMSSSNSHLDVSKITPELLYSLGFVNSPKPKFLQQIAHDFRAQVLENQNFIAVHWRFDPEDWMLRCAKQDKPNGKQNVIDICRKMEKITANDIARGIEQFRGHIYKTKKIKINSVYFAAPLTLQHLIDDVEYYIATGNSKIQFYSNFQAKIHLMQYPKCSFLSEHSNDILSSLEMDLCLHSDAFLSSDTSTWSSNIVRDRNANKWSSADSSVLEIVWKAYMLKTLRAGKPDQVGLKPA